MNFYQKLDELLGEDNSLEDIRVVARRCWHYDFAGYPLRLWQGQGKLFTSDGNEWLGTIDENGFDHHKTPAIQDGRDGSSVSYTMSMSLVNIPGQTAYEAYEALKRDQWRVANRKVTAWMVIFDLKEGLRPETPIVYFKDLVMMSPKFSEKLEEDASGKIVKSYKISVVCKDGNFGRSNVPGGTYADTIQKERARLLGVQVDKGCEYLAMLANRTYQIP